MKINSPLEAYKYLPQTNCGECGEATCMAFASKLIDRSGKTTDCAPLIKEKKFAKKLAELDRLLAPEIQEVEIGVGERAVKIGGDDVLYRHKLTFFNKTKMFFDVTDTMEEAALVERVNNIANFKKFYVGHHLLLDGVAIRSVSNDPEKFAAAVKKVAEVGLPMIFCSFNPAVLKAGLEAAKDKNPLIYAANKDNWKEVGELALEYNVPVVVSAINDLDALKTLAKTFAEAGIKNIVLDPGTYPTGKSMKESFTNFLKIRRAGITGDTEIAYPIMALPFTAWMAGISDPVSASYWETAMAAVFTIRYGDIMILHSMEPYATLPEVHLAETIYTDPRTPVAVDSKMYKVGSPTADSPVLFTTNFALTYYTVESDLSSNDIDCYLLAVNTDGIGVEASVAGGQLNADKVKDAFDKSGFDLKKDVTHNTVIIPGLAARLQGDLEDKLGANILVGPMDSGRLPGFMEKNWPPKK
ncbi:MULTISPECIES: acetyl-CoA decarbonylase/synthase complex subunit gamma [Methanosarcina]|uniref:Acetyl-CoA decarbonylase/synthase complex subunit gamma n=3 Tax=Methanosarcina barkeri TaxID=2208 RepID=A0A0E3LMU3_METBA|nr:MULTISPECIES: acetyl-CoA decarbonylase/synthase complex subunit gamma [Methanosarcina]AKB53621.1 5-tetrahydromethanopterin:corrinoid iron-sulfur protein methyltransferase [Methanosarcina barkeri MS]AKB58272.1 5-tetrahydromethanopterin:corrinoid iron-sulfur protein methyltransferase [Methanosarcina barkeri 227]AKJ39047.1 CO dehydrogenase/acetyl-CoA synthase gamma subunit CdhE1 [Methanosarcina barkeri CM1]OED09647.1 acetyl-CoA synthase subunit gamma [Methanosarcina sp. A14]